MGEVGDSPREHDTTSRLDRLAALGARVVLLGFVVASLLLARVNNSPGSADSCANLALGRSLARGGPYTTGGLVELWIRHPLDAPDTLRPPGVPYLLAVPFALFGVSLAVPVLVNAAAVLVNALALRGAIRRRGGRLGGDLALILILLSLNYELVSIWNNNLLAACTSMLLLAASRRDRGSARLPASLATWSALGFLLKQSFLLTSLPFSFLVLGTEPARTRSWRVRSLVVFLGLFLALTAVYWGRNLARHGVPLHSPSFASARLAARYNFLPHGPWRTLRFDRPATYGEVLRAIGPARMLLAEVKTIAKTVFYSVCMNPAVAACAVLVVLFWQPVRWRDYAEAVALAAGLLFEVGIYNHHEFRYLWPLYPCILFLAWLTVRDFEEWGAGQMSPALRARSRAAFALVGAWALLIGSVGALENWRHALQEARRPTPAWVDAVKGLPQSSVILTPSIGPVYWWTGRHAVICPLGDRSDLATVIEAYKSGYYLESGPEELARKDVAFTARDLSPIARGEGWGLYRIVGPIASGDPPSGG